MPRSRWAACPDWVGHFVGIRIVRIFPDLDSCLRLATVLLKEYHEDWITGRRYLRMEPPWDRELAEDLMPAA